MYLYHKIDMFLAEQLFRDTLPAFTPAHSLDTLWNKLLDLYSRLLSLVLTANRKDAKPSYLTSISFKFALTEKFSCWSKYRNSPNLHSLSVYKKARDTVSKPVVLNRWRIPHLWGMEEPLVGNGLQGKKFTIHKL